MASLETTVAKALEEVEKLFSDYKFQRLRRDQFPAEQILSAWKGSIKCGSQDVFIIVALPDSFPDEFPRIYLTRHFLYSPIPHVDNNRLVCTFDTDAIDFFAERPRELVERTIEKARGIITDGISGRNSQDFEAEFLAYWPIGSHPKKIYSILQPEKEKKKVQIATIEGNVKGIRYIIGNNKENITSYIKKLDNQAKTKKFQECLYLHLEKVPLPPYPQNNSQIFTYLSSIDPDYEKTVLEFLFANEYQGVVLFSTIINQKPVVAAWQHCSPGEKNLSKGFRPGKVSTDVISARLSSQKIVRCSVERLDSDRLQRRIGQDNNELKKKKICIIGCGTLGSHIAFYLSKSGVENLILIDNDVLLPENVSRHLCGMSEVNKKKVEAVAKRIEAHFPHIAIEQHDAMFHQVMTSGPEAVYSSDLIISATANTALERRLNQIQFESGGFPPVLYSWIEPYGIASHAVLIIRGKGGCFECCLKKDKLQYLFSVGEFNKIDSIMQEAGCQTSFTPYSALEADQASSIASRLALAYLNKDVSQSTRYVWIGNTTIMDKMGIAMNPIYEKVPALSLREYPIQLQKPCRYCRP